MLKYSEQIPKEKMGTVLSVAEKYFNTLDFEKDFERKSLIDLYIASEQYDKALEFADKFEDKNEPFYLQNICKIYRGKNNLEEALKYINQAITSDNINVYKYVKEFHKAAFLHDKAETLHEKKDESCIDTLQTAIDKQNTYETKESWSKKKNDWIAEFRN